MLSNEKNLHIENLIEVNFKQDKEFNTSTQIEKKRNNNCIHFEKSGDEHNAQYKLLIDRNEKLEKTIKKMNESMHEYDIVLTKLIFFATQVTINDIVPVNKLIALLDLLKEASKCNFMRTTESINFQFLTAGNAIYDCLNILIYKLEE